MAELSRDEAREMRDTGRRAMEQVARVAREAASQAGMSRTFARVSKVNADGTLQLELGSDLHPMPLYSVRMTTACAAAQPGDTVVVDTYAHVPLATGVIRTAGSAAHLVPQHSQDASTITGTLPVSHGGTGATTAAGARAALGLQGLGAIDRYLLSRISGSAGWVKLGAWNGSSDIDVLILDLYWGSGYNGLANQNCHTRIFVKNGYQSTNLATTAFGVTVYDDGTSDNTSKVEVYVGAYSHNGCNVFVYTPWPHANGFYTVQLSGGSWEHVSKNVSGTSNVKQDVQYCRGSFKAGSGLKVADDGTLSVDNGAYVRLLWSGKTQSEVTLSESCASVRAIVAAIGGSDGVVEASTLVWAPDGKTFDVAAAFVVGNNDWRSLRMRFAADGDKLTPTHNLGQIAGDAGDNAYLLYVVGVV